MGRKKVLNFCGNKFNAKERLSKVDLLKQQQKS